VNWSAAWAWAILAALIIVFVAVFDIHAAVTHQQTMSGQFRVWLLTPSVGPFIFGGWIGVFTGLTFHWFQYKGK
jgi:hypothetical protein